MNLKSLIKTEKGFAVVSTVKLKYTLNEFKYETMVFPSDEDGEMRTDIELDSARATNPKAAEANHDYLVAKWLGRTEKENRFLVLEAGTLDMEERSLDDFKNEYDAIYESVGGLICSVTGYFDLPRDVQAWVDDEGLLKQLKPSCITTATNPFTREREVIHLAGNVVFTGTTGLGETRPLEDEELIAIKKKLLNLPLLKYKEINKKGEIEEGEALLLPQR